MVTNEPFEEHGAVGVDMLRCLVDITSTIAQRIIHALQLNIRSSRSDKQQNQERILEEHRMGLGMPRCLVGSQSQDRLRCLVRILAANVQKKLGGHFGETKGIGDG